MENKTIVIDFKDAEDKKNFLWIMKAMKEGGDDYRMPPLFVGLMNSILKDIAQVREEDPTVCPECGAPLRLGECPDCNFHT